MDAVDKEESSFLENFVLSLHINMYIYTHIFLYLYMNYPYFAIEDGIFVYQNIFLLYKLFSLVFLFCTSAFLFLLGLIGADR